MPTKFIVAVDFLRAIKIGEGQMSTSDDFRSAEYHARAKAKWSSDVASAHHDAPASVCEVTVRLQFGSERLAIVAEGSGVADAMFNALQKGLCENYPFVKETVLNGYHVAMSEGCMGSSAEVGVRVSLKHGNAYMIFRSTSADTLEATWNALCNGFYAIIQIDRETSKQSGESE